jgi:hypothetical protein
MSICVDVSKCAAHIFFSPQEFQPSLQIFSFASGKIIYANCNGMSFLLMYADELCIGRFGI